MRLALAITAIATLMSAAAAGPLSPPPGAPAPTNKTLNQVQPATPVSAANTPGDPDAVFRITQPGAYYLTGPVAVPAGDHGIVIEASNVTLDLNGFPIEGQSATTLDGILIDGPVTITNVTVRNGRISDMGGRGVNADFTRNARLESIAVEDCASDGFYAPGEAGAMLNCHAEECGGDGFLVGNDAVIRDCTSIRNTGDGFELEEGVTATRCVARFNDGFGIRGGSNVVIAECVARGNGAVGISTVGNAVVVNSVSESHSQAGFAIGQGSVVRNCAARLSDGDGFFLNTSVHIEGCVALNNDRHGIAASNGATIINNICSFNNEGNVNGAGISVTGTANRIDSNTTNDQQFGILVLNEDNLIIRNSAHGNFPNYSIDPDATFGQIISTFLGGQIPTPDPWANFEY
ncbi:MAG: right-handed parallel beta-helix repeat-containing protein [Planctomycetota bacterium]